MTRACVPGSYSSAVLPPDAPSHLPSANSRKWHTRRWRDGLGYLRVRSLANADYRDAGHLLNALRHERERAVPTGDRRLVDAVDRALVATKHAKGPGGGDESWWQAVAAVDEVLRHQERLRLEKQETDQ